MKHNASSSAPPESALVGATGSAFHHTTELQVMKLYEALQSEDKEAWEAAVADELDRFKKHSVFEVVEKRNIPARTRPLTTTWNMKKKANGTFRARLTIRGFEQVPNVHYRPEWISAPVSNAVTIRIMLVLLLMMGGYAHIVDVCSAFLLGLFDNDEERVYVSIPKGWDKFFPANTVLLLMKTVYGLKQAANCLYGLLVSVMLTLGFAKSHADPCLYFKWDATHGLIVWLSWIGDLLVFNKCEACVLAEVQGIKEVFDVDDVGPLEDYLGCKLDFNWSVPYCRLTQPVLVQSMRDLHGVDTVKRVKLPATSGTTLQKA